MFDRDNLEAKFARIGARLRVDDGSGRRRQGLGGRVRLDVRGDEDGEYFEIAARPDSAAGVEVLDVRRDDRHLLLLVREGGEKAKFLCGHDERHWFVAAVPEAAPVGTVPAAKEALKPPEVRDAQDRLGLGATARGRRKNDAYRRQGEWFFVPAPRLGVNPALVLRDEPITRGNGSKPHRLEFCYRSGGEPVHVCNRHPAGLGGIAYRELLRAHPEARSWGWRIMVQNADVYARGRVRHADHRTITLHGWHRVLMNTEGQSRAMRNVAFLD
jgi:hypothetical protein